MTLNLGIKIKKGKETKATIIYIFLQRFYYILDVEIEIGADISAYVWSQAICLWDFLIY